MEVCKYTIFTKQDLAAIQAGLNSAISAWADKWFITVAALPVADTVVNGHEAVPLESGRQGLAGSFELRSHSSGACQLAYSSRTLQHLYSRITGDHVIKATSKDLFGTVGSAVLLQALDDLLAIILQGHDAASSEQIQLSQLLRKGSGTVVATITDQDSTIHLYLSQSLARMLSGTTGIIKTGAKLSSRQALIGSGKLKIQVTAGEAELRLADLMELRPGNVIRLNLKPNQPFTVQMADTQQVICHAYLGKRDNNKAIELTT
ncbi:type III flagellar switch regulator (C-ring) FliN [Paucimonas lemoignei]|uniref:Type III flagellar switch regulator (C-ring) FliN n=1 Tax=Paucimonas lemoignei TaxID=29443 RepID=A0A4R3I1J2_PAULE|nr:FliM/FliN family flagellar motor C-terminal domain-containing protein [Paucimonas lemoignei]TCS37729.1 type III flagellar switch regulator (C-ring) FliN [Paucimonas lemoignei]